MNLSKKTVISAAIIVLFLGTTLISLSSMFSKGGGEKKVIVVLETTLGAIELELNPEKAPITVSNFVQYVEEGFFNGTVFHRVIPEFMIQGGGFLPNMTQKDAGDPIKLESDNGLKNDRGTVAMARTSDPDSATSQFFINLIDNDFLNRRSGVDGYAVFGEVVTGMDVVDKIGAVRTGSKGPYQDWPVRDVVIEGAYVKNGADS